MKITVEIPNELLIAAKKRAREIHQPFKKLIENGLRQQLATSHHGKRVSYKKLRWVVSKGGLPPAVNISDRQSIHNWLRKLA